MNKTMMGKSEFARSIDKSPSFFTKMIAKEVITDYDGKICFEEAVVQLIEHKTQNNDERRTLLSASTKTSFIVVLEQVSGDLGVSLGKALEMLLLESKTFNSKFDACMVDAPWLVG